VCRGRVDEREHGKGASKSSEKATAVGLIRGCDARNLYTTAIAARSSGCNLERLGSSDFQSGRVHFVWLVSLIIVGEIY
jgi:hypothetical protein